MKTTTKTMKIRAELVDRVRDRFELNGSTADSGSGPEEAEAAEEAETEAGTETETETETETGEELKILALEGGFVTGMGEYSAVLVYACETDPRSGDPGVDLVLLSRTPDIAPRAVSRLLSVAASYGISTDCDNPFVPTLQRPDRCASV
jgi:hypothetical protein